MKQNLNVLIKKIYMNWSEAYYKTKKAELWGYIDLSENFTQDTLEKLFKIFFLIYSYPISFKFSD